MLITKTLSRLHLTKSKSQVPLLLRMSTTSSTMATTSNSSTIVTQVLASSVAIADRYFLISPSNGFHWNMLRAFHTMPIFRAGEIVRAIWSGGDLGIVEKTGKDDLQTQADRWTHKYKYKYKHKYKHKIRWVDFYFKSDNIEHNVFLQICPALHCCFLGSSVPWTESSWRGGGAGENFTIVTSLNDIAIQDLSGVPADWIVSSSNKEAASNISCPPALATATLDQITVWVDPLDGTAEYTQVGLLAISNIFCFIKVWRNL